MTGPGFESGPYVLQANKLPYRPRRLWILILAVKNKESVYNRIQSSDGITSNLP